MTRTAGLFAVGVAVFLLVLAVNFPVQQLVSSLEAAIPGLRLEGVRGTVFSGSAAGVGFRGRALGPANWSFRPVALAGARLEYDISVGHTEDFVVARAGITPTGKFYGQDVRVALQPDYWINRVAPVAIRTSGNARLLLDNVEWQDNFIHNMAGRLEWHNVAILAPINVVVGTVAADLQSMPDRLVANIIEPGELGISGTIELEPDAAYHVDLELHPGAQVAGDTLEMLEIVTMPGKSGGYIFRQSGQL